MSGDNLHPDRRSTRLPISIPVVISGMDAEGNSFSETVHTLIVNKHGGKVVTTHYLAVGTEVLIKNPSMGVAAKATVAWLGVKHYAGDLHAVGLQLLEAQNVWGIAFPPEDWTAVPKEEAPPPPDDPPASPHVGAVGTEAQAPSLAGEEITIRLLQELQESADAHAREFQDRLKLLIQRLGLEFESNLYERVAHAKAREVGALEEEIKALRESLSAVKEEIATLEARVQELKCGLEAATGTPLPNPTLLQEARGQFTDLTNSVVESMNRAAEAGLKEYRSLLQKENQESAARRRPGTEENPLPPGGPLPEP